jgi:hypothetical protein
LKFSFTYRAANSLSTAVGKLAIASLSSRFLGED